MIGIRRLAIGNIFIPPAHSIQNVGINSMGKKIVKKMSRKTCEGCNDHVPDMTIQVVDGRALCPSCRIAKREKVKVKPRMIIITIKFE